MAQNNQKLLSIVTVCSNDVDRLKITTTSLHAFYDDNRFEHIVIDSMSDDQTPFQLHHLSKHANFKYLSEQDQGIYDAMNKGVCLSDGKWVLFLNCGDIIVPTPDQLAYNLVCYNTPQKSQILCYRFFTSGANVCRLHNVKKFSRKRLPTSHQAMIFSAHFLKLNPFDISYVVAADFELFLRTNFEKISVDPQGLALSNIEIEGFASANPLISYKEYLLAILKNTAGIFRLWLLANVFSRFVCVLTIKFILPNFIFKKLRNWL